MLSRRAAVDYSAIAHLGLKRRELLIGPPTIGAVYDSDLIGLQLGVKKLEQMGPSDGVDQHRTMFDRPPLKAHAVAIASDLKANHAPTKGLIQRLGVARVIAETRSLSRTLQSLPPGAPARRISFRRWPPPKLGSQSSTAFATVLLWAGTQGSSGEIATRVTCSYTGIRYTRYMIRSFGDKRTETLFWDGIVREFRSIAPRAKRKLEAVNAASRLEDLRLPPSNRLEKLKGDLGAFHSIRINDQWRIIFKWLNGEPHAVQIVDYH